MIKSLFKSRNRRATTRRSMQVEGLESRALLTINAPIFVGDATNFYLQFTGTDNADVFLLGDTPFGDVVFQAWEDWDGTAGFDEWELEQDGTVSAGEIALAGLLQYPGRTFGGVIVNGGAGNDVIDGNAPNATPYNAPFGGVTINTAFGSITSPADYNIIADGGAGNDQIRTGNGRDVLNGGGGNDSLIGGGRPDSFNGGDGNDLVVADRFDSPNSILGGAGSDTLNDDPAPSGTPGGVGLNVNNRDFEEVILDNGARDRVDNRNFNDTSTTDSKTNTVSVRVRTFGGDDLIISGPDTLAGGVILQENLDGGAGGSDTISYEGYTTGVTVNLNNPQSVVGANDVITNFENVTGGSGNDTLIGNGFNNVLNGGAGNDTIQAGAGDDTVNAGAGEDSVLGGGGNDVINAGADNDTVSGGAGDDQILGEAGNDELAGNAGNDSINGGDGADLLEGGADNDVLNGGTDGSSDEVYGQGGNDTIVIPWSYILPFLTNRTATPPGAYYGGPGLDNFLIVTPTATDPTPADFQNAFDNFVLWLGFNSLTDWGSPDTVNRSTTAPF
jgi:Ca2+-binding RTX toxin-like protein